MNDAGLTARIESGFYRLKLKIFGEEKEPDNFFSYKSFQISKFRGLENVSINFSRNDLVLLLGLNESGKTSILKAIEAFDFSNDPEEPSLKSFFSSIRNKQDIDCSTPSVITAQIEFNKELDFTLFKRVLKEAQFLNQKSEVEAFLDEINAKRKVAISRVIPFNNGDPKQSFYKFEDESPFSDSDLESVVAQEIVRRSPFILYFEDFQDSIPEKVFTSPRKTAFNQAWYEIIDGLFYNTDKSYSIKKFLKYFSPSNRRDDDARTVIKKVNKTLQDTFTTKWKDLSGVQEIAEAEITFQEKDKYFEIKITERDGTTFSVQERSKGAIWYLAFLMKTEFRRKKLREGSGKPIYLIDEPASNLHSTAQQKMIGDFVKLVEDTTLIYTTHSRYLISLNNIKNTFVVKRENGVVSCTKWSEYIKGRDAKVSYYQPLFDCLDVVPTNLDIPWSKAILTEGPSDALVLEIMRSLLELECNFAIYPGSSASNLETLVSLNIGWGADFRILLDSDDEGEKAKQNLEKKFALDQRTLISLPASNSEIELMFTMKEKSKLYELAFGEKVESVSKKQFLAMMKALWDDIDKLSSEVKKSLGAPTITRFEKLFDSLMS